jgi:hypothetical protein
LSSCIAESFRLYKLWYLLILIKRSFLKFSYNGHARRKCISFSITPSSQYKISHIEVVSLVFLIYLLCVHVCKKLLLNFQGCWSEIRDKCLVDKGKLDTYFTFKTSYNYENYLDINNIEKLEYHSLCQKHFDKLAQTVF